MRNNKPSILLDLDQTLISAEASDEIDFSKYKHKEYKFRVDDMDGYYMVYSRPHLQEFLDYLMGHVEMQIHITQHIDAPSDRVGTSNAIVKESIISGEPKGYEVAGAAKPKSDAEIRCEQLTVNLAKANEENNRLKARIAELELKLVELEGPKSKTASNLEAAKTLDEVVNN